MELVDQSKCKVEVLKFVAKHLQKQSWVPTHISQKKKYLMIAISFRNTLDGSAHILWNEGNKTHYLKRSIEKKKTNSKYLDT